MYMTIYGDFVVCICQYIEILYVYVNIQRSSCMSKKFH